MISTTNLTSDSIYFLQNKRDFSEQQVTDFSALLEKANTQLNQDHTAKQVLSSFSESEMALLQRAAGQVERIEVNKLSREGAENLLAQPDKTGMVDLNNDGIVEIGKSRTITFPPVNAPDSIHTAWDKATEGMTEGEKLTMELHMHTAVYGFQIDGVESKTVLPPEQQWSESGWNQLITELRSNLEFSVALDGWSRTHLVHQEFYNRFENELNRIG